MRHHAVIGWLCLGLAGCVIPPPLERENLDASVNSIPVITRLDPNFPSPGPIAIHRREQEPMSLTVRDNDLNDTVYVYLFVDYNYPRPVPPLSSCQSSVTELDRTLTCPLNTLCAFEEGPPDQLHFLEALVTDRALLPEGEPLYRALPPGTGVSHRAWLMTCHD
jgi:hypothetical protein